MVFNSGVISLSWFRKLISLLSSLTESERIGCDPTEIKGEVNEAKQAFGEAPALCFNGLWGLNFVNRTQGL
jgi:hypothetical protein